MEQDIAFDDFKISNAKEQITDSCVSLRSLVHSRTESLQLYVTSLFKYVPVVHIIEICDNTPKRIRSVCFSTP